MKKFLFSTIVLATLAITKTNAQVKDNLSFGPIAGFGHTYISGIANNNIQNKFNPSLNIGVRLVYSVHPHWGFGADLSFQMAGAKLGYTYSDSSDILIRLHANYLRFDPKAYYFFGRPGQSFRPKIGLGPSIGFLIGGKTKNYQGSTLIDENKTKETIKSFDFGLSGALGFNYRLSSKTWLNADLVYTHGLPDILKQNPDNAIHNRSMFLNVGILFGIGGAKK